MMIIETIKIYIGLLLTQDDINYRLKISVTLFHKMNQFQFNFNALFKIIT